MLHSSTPENPNCRALELCKILGPLETILRDPYDKHPLLAVARVYLLVLTDILRQRKRTCIVYWAFTESGGVN